MITNLFTNYTRGKSEPKLLVSLQFTRSFFRYWFSAKDRRTITWHL